MLPFPSIDAYPLQVDSKYIYQLQNVLSSFKIYIYIYIYINKPFKSSSKNEPIKLDNVERKMEKSEVHSHGKWSNRAEMKYVQGLFFNEPMQDPGSECSTCSKWHLTLPKEPNFYKKFIINIQTLSIKRHRSLIKYKIPKLNPSPKGKRLKP